MPTYTPSVENVLSVYFMARPENVENGLSWYSDANHFANTLSEIYDIPGINVAMAAGVLAALSPLQHWEPNKRLAAKAFAQGNGNGLGLTRNCVKVDRILSGENPLDVLGGNKVRAFYSTILNPAGLHIPVIDRHAFDIAIGEVTDDAAKSFLGRKGVYQAFADTYIVAAAEVGIGSAQMQAVTWLEWRNLKAGR